MNNKIRQQINNFMHVVHVLLDSQNDLSRSVIIFLGTVNLFTGIKYIDELEREKVLKARKSGEICVAMRSV
jgi:hypothetical protein